MTFLVSYPQLLARLTKVHGRVTRRGFGYTLSWHFRGSPKFATTKADLLEHCLRALDCPFSWSRSDGSPAYKRVKQPPSAGQPEGAERGKVLQSTHIRLRGSTFATACLRKAMRQTIGHATKDKLLREAIDVTVKVGELLRYRDDALIAGAATVTPASETPEPSIPGIASALSCLPKVLVSGPTA